MPTASRRVEQSFEPALLIRCEKREAPSDRPDNVNVAAPIGTAAYAWRLLSG